MAKTTRIDKPKKSQPPHLNQWPWVVKRISPNVHSIQITGAANKTFEQWVLLRSDVHHDNPKCKQHVEKRHLDEALARKAIVIDNGDLFCAMQGKYDKRSSKQSLRPEHSQNNYLDSLVDTAAEFYQPYAKCFAILGQGNHETGILKNHETNLTDRLAAEMRRYGSPVFSSGYGGWVLFNFVLSQTERHAITFHHYHGSGGGGPVTRGVIQTNRMAVYTPDADIILTGHTHDSWIVPIPRQRINSHGTLFHDEALHVRAPGYKDAWGDGYGGWEVETAKGPKPIGSLWLRFFYSSARKKITTEVTRATE